MSLSAEDLKDFRGVVPLFPLPNFVMLPHVVKAFHMFEPRYCELTSHALTTDRFLAIARFEPGWEEDYEGSPRLRPIACLVRIINHQRTPQGTFNLLVRGVSRLRIDREILSLTIFRQVEATPIVDPVIPVDSETRAELAAAALPWVPGGGPARAQLQMLLNTNLNLGAIVDVIAFALPLPLAGKEQLLETLEVAQRYQLLINILRAGPETALPPEPPSDSPQPRRWFPEFSKN
jgi:Lon protease-like protein